MDTDNRLSEVQKRIEEIDSARRELSEREQEAVGRVNAVHERRARLSAEQVELRGERGKLLASGQDAGGIAKRLRTLRDAEEESQDEIAALSPATNRILTEVAEQRKALEEERQGLEDEIKRINARVAGRHYNVVAEQFAQVVAELHKALQQCPNSSRVLRISGGDWDVLDFVARVLIIGEDEIPTSEMASRNMAFFRA